MIVAEGCAQASSLVVNIHALKLVCICTRTGYSISIHRIINPVGTYPGYLLLYTVLL